MSAKIYYMSDYRAPEPPADAIDDTKQDERWVKFKKLAKSAFAWRDHATLDELEKVIGKLRPNIEVTLDAAVEA